MNPDKIRKSLSDNFAEMISDYTFHQIELGLSPSKVFLLRAENKANLYLKVSPRFPGFSLLQEKIRLEWLENRLPVPKVLLFAEQTNADYLLLTEISGIPAADDSLKDDVPRIIRQLATGLKMIHSVSIKNCPFDERLAPKIELALERMRKGIVDESDFDEERLGKSIEDLAVELLETKPASEDLVFTHGDYCVPNVILENRKLNGFVDWGKAGIADRFQDLALLSRSVRHNFGEKHEESVFKIYGIEPDREKIHYYRLLDEFF